MAAFGQSTQHTQGFVQKRLKTNKPCSKYTVIAMNVLQYMDWVYVFRRFTCGVSREAHGAPMNASI